MLPPAPGNAWTDTVTENSGAVSYWWMHGMTSDEATTGMRANCDFSAVGPLSKGTMHLMVSRRDARPWAPLFSAGNALTDSEIDSKGALAFWYYHGLISDPAHDGILDNCDFASITPLVGPGDGAEKPRRPSPQCQSGLTSL